METVTNTLAEAFDRIDDFNSIHLGRTEPDAFVEAIRCLQESVGLDDDGRELLAIAPAESSRSPRAVTEASSWASSSA